MGVFAEAGLIDALGPMVGDAYSDDAVVSPCAKLSKELGLAEDEIDGDRLHVFGGAEPKDTLGPMISEADGDKFDVPPGEAEIDKVALAVSIAVFDRVSASSILGFINKLGLAVYGADGEELMSSLEGHPSG